MSAMALVIATVAGGSATPDGTALHLVTTAQGGTEVILSFPYEELLTVIATAIQARTDCKKLRGLNPDQDADLVETKRYELGWDTRSGVAVLMMTLANGGKMSFSLPGNMVSGMHETLGMMLRREMQGAKNAADLH